MDYHSIYRPLRRRENQVLQLLGDGCSTADIAQYLRIGDGTVVTYYSELKACTGTSTMKDLRRMARRWQNGELQIVVPIKREILHGEGLPEIAAIPGSHGPAGREV